MSRSWLSYPSGITRRRHVFGLLQTPGIGSTQKAETVRRRQELYHVRWQVPNTRPIDIVTRKYEFISFFFFFCFFWAQNSLLLLLFYHNVCFYTHTPAHQNNFVITVYFLSRLFVYFYLFIFLFIFLFFFCFFSFFDRRRIPVAYTEQVKYAAGTRPFGQPLVLPSQPPDGDSQQPVDVQLPPGHRRSLMAGAVMAAKKNLTFKK